MAIFVMAVGVLSLAALFPLGLRESVQSQADLKQSMFADYMLNTIVSAVSSPDLSWDQWWGQWAQDRSLIRFKEGDMVSNLDYLPPFLESVVMAAASAYNAEQPSNLQLERNISYAVYCVPVPGHSSMVMGILVRSLSMDTSVMETEEKKRRLEAQPVYYAEARFQGRIQ